MQGSKENKKESETTGKEWRCINEAKCNQLPAEVEGNGGLWIIELISKCLAWATGLRFVPCPERETAGEGEGENKEWSLLLDFKILVYGNPRAEHTGVDIADHVVSEKQQS